MKPIQPRLEKPPLPPKKEKKKKPKLRGCENIDNSVDGSLIVDFTIKM